MNVALKQNTSSRRTPEQKDQDINDMIDMLINRKSSRVIYNRIRAKYHFNISKTTLLKDLNKAKERIKEDIYGRDIEVQRSLASIYQSIAKLNIAYEMSKQDQTKTEVVMAKNSTEQTSAKRTIISDGGVGEWKILVEIGKMEMKLLYLFMDCGVDIAKALGIRTP